MKLVVSLVAAAAAFVISATASAREPLTVIDGTGQIIGTPISVEVEGGSFETITYVAVDAGDRAVLLPIRRSGFRQGPVNGEWALFQNSDCTGPVHMIKGRAEENYLWNPINSNLYQRSLVFGPNDTLYVHLGGQAVQVAYQAYTDLDLRAGLGSCTVKSGVAFGWLLTPVADLKTKFTPPFNLRRSDLVKIVP
jgi:hypothetical protein